MIKYVIILALALAFYSLQLQAENNKPEGDKPLRKSQFNDLTQPGNTSCPKPFNELNNIIEYAAISTGYYFVDSESNAGKPWVPKAEIIDTTENPTNWHRIISGPRQLKIGDEYKRYWIRNPGEGLRFFRNPALTGISSSI